MLTVEAVYRCAVVTLLLLTTPSSAEAGLWRWLWSSKAARQARRNARDGLRRERRVVSALRRRHPLSRVLTQRTLLCADGSDARDPHSDQARRFDAALVGPTGRVRSLIEITSKNADKSAQLSKTERILAEYGRLFIEDPRTGRLLAVRRGWFLPTRVQLIRRR